MPQTAQIRSNDNVPPERDIIRISARKETHPLRTSFHWQNDTFGCALTICSFSPPGIRVFGRRPGRRGKNAATRAMRESKCRGIPSKPALLTGHGTLPARKPGCRESPPEDSAGKMTRETCPGKSSNGKEKRPRSRREKVSVPGFFRPSPEIKIPSPEKRIPGLGISRSGPEISRQTAPKSKCL